MQCGQRNRRCVQEPVPQCCSGLSVSTTRPCGAEATACWGVVVRSARHAGEMSPVPLRLCMAPADGGLNVEILRNRYGTAGRVLLPC